MRPATRLCVCVLLVALVLAGAVYACSFLAGRADASLAGDLPGEARRADDLDRADAAVRQRLEVKEKAVRGVIAGQLTLKQAVARFREAHAGDPRALRGAGSEEERIARNVLAWVRAELHGQGSRAEAVLVRLDEEMRELLGRDERATDTLAPR